jgi:hypothetical protein
MAKTGDTIRVLCEFKTFAGVYADPSTITLKVYDKDRQQIGSTISITESHKTATGKYQYDYTIPASTGTPITFEWSGTLEGSTALSRKDVSVTWS